MKNIVSFRDQLLEALKNGKTEEALKIFEELYQGTMTTHDRLVDYCNLLLTFVSQKSGEEGVKEAWESVIDISHKKSLKRFDDLQGGLPCQFILYKDKEDRKCNEAF